MCAYVCVMCACVLVCVRMCAYACVCVRLCAGELRSEGRAALGDKSELINTLKILINQIMI